MRRFPSSFIMEVMSKDDESEEIALGFPGRLRQARSRAKLTQEKLALKVGYPNSNPASIISRWETAEDGDHSPPNIPTLKRRKKIAIILGVNYNWLYKNRGPMIIASETGNTDDPGGQDLHNLIDHPLIKGIHSRLDKLEETLNSISEALGNLEQSKEDPRTRRTT